MNEPPAHKMVGAIRQKYAIIKNNNSICRVANFISTPPTARGDELGDTTLL